jgi:3-dehydroquinate dehydratase/shikimate dehydrogenase
MAPRQRETRLICPLIGPDVESMRAGMAAAAAAGADAVECRLDYLSRTPTERELAGLLADPPLEAIVTYRSAEQGGRSVADAQKRMGTLRQAARFAPAYVDVELGAEPRDWPAAPVILSRHDLRGCPADLESILAEMEASPAAVSKVAFTASGPEDAFRALEMLRSARKPTIALAMGEAGLASRILAGKFGAFGTFAALEQGGESAPGQPTIEEFKRLYCWDSLGPGTAVYGVIGCPVAHSLSPAIHNAVFAAVGIDAVYLPLRVEAGGDNFKRFMDSLLARPWLDWRGLSVTIPHKENALAYVGKDNCEELARKIGAINTITIDAGGACRGHNTDYAAALDALCSAMRIRRQDLVGRTVAVLGAGGAGRAIVAGLRHYGAQVEIFSRTVSRAEALAEEFSCRAAGMDGAARTGARIVINCTPVGMHPQVDASPMEDMPPRVEAVFDTIYNPVQTRLLRQARRGGLLTVSGLEMFVNQGAAQFEIWTGRPAPRELMRQVAREALGAQG